MIIPRLSSTIGLAQTLVSLRSGMVDLQRQFATGRLSETYGGLGLGRDTSLAIRAKASAITGYQDTIGQLDLRLKLMNESLTQIGQIAADAKADARQLTLNVENGQQTFGQRAAEAQLKEVLSLLSQNAAGRFLFSGRATDSSPVETYDVIMRGAGGKAGFLQVTEERRIADLGADGLGRLDVSPLDAGTNSFTIADTYDKASPPLFGMKIAAVNSQLDGMSVTGPDEPGNQYGFALDAQPKPGQTLTMSFQLPDGSYHDVVLTAQAEKPGVPPGPGKFYIGATPGETVENLHRALDHVPDPAEGPNPPPSQPLGALQRLAGGELTATSAFKASEEFFGTGSGGEPIRVAGYDLADPVARLAALQNATGLADEGTASATVSWYRGDDDQSVRARDTASARVADGIDVAYGARANEAPLAEIVGALAVFATQTFDKNVEGDAERYTAVMERLVTRLDQSGKQANVQNMAAELASVQKAAKRAGDRHVTEKGFAEDMLDEIEGISQEEVALKLLNLQTRLQASYEATAMLSRMSLVNYL